jgi:hypothetical protein
VRASVPSFVAKNECVTRSPAAHAGSTKLEHDNANGARTPVAYVYVAAAYVSICQHTSAYVSICQHVGARTPVAYVYTKRKSQRSVFVLVYQ